MLTSLGKKSIEARAKNSPAPSSGAEDEAVKRQIQYQKRRAAGLCAYFGCEVPPQIDRSYCSEHLKRMVVRNKRRAKRRKGQNLCVYCGLRPQFWSVRCLICRQKFTSDPLPFGARRALRLLREAEEQFQLEQLEAGARFAIRKLLASGDVTGNEARALRLYAGLDRGRWRTYGEVGKTMRLSKERVRQLLHPSKTAVAQALGGRVPWKLPPHYQDPVQLGEQSHHAVSQTRSSVAVSTINFI